MKEEWTLVCQKEFDKYNINNNTAYNNKRGMDISLSEVQSLVTASYF